MLWTYPKGATDALHLFTDIHPVYSGSTFSGFV